jgi:hypothetical protein
MKQYTKCGEEKDLSALPSGSSKYAKRKESQKEYRSRDHVRKKLQEAESSQYRKDQHKYKHIARKYGLSKSDYDTLISLQDNKCKICYVEFTNESRVSGPNVDHNHESGDIRGLLCRQCNSGLGMFMDNQELLNNAIKYLQESTICLKEKYQLSQRKIPT